MVRFTLLLLFIITLPGCASNESVTETEPDERPNFEIWEANGAIESVSDRPANGIAQARYLNNGTYMLAIRLNIEPLPAGKDYEVWLQHPDNNKMKSLGTLKSASGDVRHIYEFKIKRDWREYTKLIVTLADEHMAAAHLK